MPLRALKPCKVRGCKELTREANGYCYEHQTIAEEAARMRAARYDQARGNANKRGYDSTWERLRRMYLKANPLCEDCLEQDIYSPAVEVHHKKKVKDFPALRLVWSNLRSLCKSCHSKRTARGE